MAYLGVYAFPGENVCGVKQQMIAPFEPLRDGTDIDVILEKTLRLAEVLRRPWSEPPNPGEPTI